MNSDGQEPGDFPDAGGPRHAASRLGLSALENLLDHSAEGVVVLSRDWTYTYANARAAELLHRDSPADLIGKHAWTEFPEGAEPFQDAYRRAMETQKSATFEAHFAPWDQWFENRVIPSADGLIETPILVHPRSGADSRRIPHRLGHR